MILVSVLHSPDTEKNSIPKTPEGDSLFLPNTFHEQGLCSLLWSLLFNLCYYDPFSCSLSPLFLFVLRKENTESARCLDRVRQMVSLPQTTASGISPGHGSQGAPASPQRTSHSWRMSGICEAIMCLACLIDRTSRGDVGSYQPHCTDKKTKAWEAPTSCSGPGC